MASRFSGPSSAALACALLCACAGGPVGEAPRAPAPRVPVARTPSVVEREAAIAKRARGYATAGVPRVPVPSGDADLDLAVCAAWLATGRADQARPAFVALRRVHPTDPVVALAAARFQLEDGEPALAAALLEELADRGVAHDELRLLRGVAHIRSGDPDLGVPLLREELATGPRSAAAAVALCDHFTAVELFGDARAVIAAARGREPARADLRLVEARLLHDTWRLADAEVTLDALLAEQPDLAAARVQRAEIARARGRPAEGRAVLESLDVADPWCAGHTARIEALRVDLASERAALTGRDLLAMTRGADGLGTRMRALEALLEVPATRAEGVRVGLLQEEPVLRIVALRAIPVDDPALPDDLAAAVADPDPRVRGAALRRTVDVRDADRAVRLACAGLEAEEDPYAFRAAHDALTARLGPRVALLADAERDPDVRNRVRRAWRRECPE